MMWKIRLPDLLKEMIEGNPTAWVLRMPVLILRRMLAQLAERAIAIDDPELNIMMLRLGLYDVHPLEVDATIANQKQRLNHDPALALHRMGEPYLPQQPEITQG